MAEEPDPGPADLPAEDASEDEAGLALQAVLAELWSEWSQQHGPLSLARLCKRTGLRMSTLKRFLTALESSALVSLSVNQRGVECAILTEQAAASLGAALGTADPSPPSST